MPPIPSEAISSLTWIVLGRAAWTPLDHWVAVVGGEQAEAAWRGELVVVWDHDHEGRAFREPMITLTPWGAWCVEREVRDGRWRRTSNESPSTQSPYANVPGVYNMAFPEHLVDPRPGPLEQLIDQESGLPVMLWGRSVEIDRRISQPRRVG